MVDVEMERWRSYFGKSGADIWTVIHQAINVAAVDYPKDFRERRGEIAETLFARNLLELHTKDDPAPTHEEGEVRDGEPRLTNASDRVVCGDVTGHRHSNCFHDDAEALSDEPEVETLMSRNVDAIKATIRDADQPESVILEALRRLQSMQMTVEALKATEIGKHVNSLKKNSSKRVRAIVKELVRRWKVLVDEWVDSARDVTAAATGTDGGEHCEGGIHENGLPLPSLDEVALLEARARTVDLSQLFSFMDGEICTGNKDNHNSSNSVEPSVKDNLNYLSRSQSGSMLTDSSDFDTKASTNHPWGLRTPEERGSATRDMYPPSGKFEKMESAFKGQTGQRDKGHKGVITDGGVQVSKNISNGTGSGRACNDVSKAKPNLGPINTEKTTNNDFHSASCNHVVSKTVMTHSGSVDKFSAMKSDKSQVDQKLEIAKRKLHQGYQQAENAKKQRTVQVLNFPDIPKSGQVGKSKPVQNKSGGQGGQNRRFT